MANEGLGWDPSTKNITLLGGDDCILGRGTTQFIVCCFFFLCFGTIHPRNYEESLGNKLIEPPKKLGETVDVFRYVSPVQVW